MSLLENVIAFAGYQTAFSAQCVKRSAACGLLLGAREGGKYAGYLSAVRESGMIRILYAYTVPSYRGRGVFTALMRFVLRNTETAVRVSIPQNHPFHDPVVKVCLAEGMKKAESARVFTCHKEMYPVWARFMKEKGDRLCDYLKRRGYRSAYFAELGEEAVGQLRESGTSDYRNALDPSVFLDVPENRLSWEMSCAALKEGRLAGYVLVTLNSPTKAVFEHISESAGQQGTGLILLPFAAAMKKVFTESEVQTVSFAMYGSNARANAFREEALNMLNPSVTISENYIRVCQRVSGNPSP